jgi:hypothetical protein
MGPTIAATKLGEMRFKIVVMLAIAAALAAAGAPASWKWSSSVRHANAPYKIAGWSWGDEAPYQKPGRDQKPGSLVG